MPDHISKDRLGSAEAIASEITRLIGLDRRLEAVAALAGPVTPRIADRGFEGLARIICGQQLSVASASAIWGRFSALPGALRARSFLEIPQEAVRAAGMSAGKLATLQGTAEAIVAGSLDLETLETLPAGEAIGHLVTLKGIGAWTAEIYLLFCAGHSDIFPGGDLALQKAVAHGLSLDQRPDNKALRALAIMWSPHRGAAALLFWRYFAALRDREGILL